MNKKKLLKYFAFISGGVIILVLLESGRKFVMKIRPKKEFLPIYEEISRETGLPIEFIVAHAHVESNQNHLAIGGKGEYGLWQFLPDTWRSIMGNADWRSVENQKIAYIRHAKHLIERFKLNPKNKEDLKKFLWAWNAGPGAVEKNRLPLITKIYIDKVMGYV